MDAMALLRCALVAACAIHGSFQPARATPRELPDFAACRDKELICYQYVARIRSVQLDSEREKLFVDGEADELADWQAQREHLRRSLWSQFVQTWILLLIGIVIVGAGLVMSWKHMVHGLRDGIHGESAVDIGRDGVRLSSPVVGLFVFGASIWFFNIYIDKVYWLFPLQARPEQAAQAAARRAQAPRPQEPPTRSSPGAAGAAPPAAGAPAAGR